MPVRKPKSCPHRGRFGKNIASLRKRRKLTQENLGKKVRASVRYIQSLEAGEYFPSLPTLIRLKSALHCGWEDLFAGCERT
jgi:transcriptional regulator with XRE-family HTH domain